MISPSCQSSTDLELPLHSGLFLTLGIGDWGTLERGLYLLADEPAVVQEAMALQGELAGICALPAAVGETDATGAGQ